MKERVDGGTRRGDSSVSNLAKIHRDADRLLSATWGLLKAVNSIFRQAEALHDCIERELRGGCDDDCD